MLVTPGLRTFFAFDLPSTLILLACVGIFAIAGELMWLGHAAIVRIQRAGFLELNPDEDEEERRRRRHDATGTDDTNASAQSIASSNDIERPSDHAVSNDSSPI